MSNQDREVFNSDSLPKKSNEDAVRRNDLFCHESNLIHAGNLGSNPKGAKITSRTGEEYVVTTLRYTDQRGRVFEVAKAWEVASTFRGRKRF